MGLTITPSDTTDTTEEAVLALVKARHDEAEAAGDEARVAAYRDLAEAIAAGEHWNQPGQSV